MNLIDLHCDTFSKLYLENKQLCKNKFHIDIEKLKKANSIGQFFAVFIDQKETLYPFDYSNELINLFYSELEKNKDYISFASNYNELDVNTKQNKISAFLTIEGGEAIEGKMDNLYLLHNLGVSLITLTWNYHNEIGYPNHEFKYSNNGLTPFGKDLVEEMNKLNMIIDVSHLSDQGFYDVSQISNSPFLASHSNARSIENNARNLTDNMIKTISNSGGLIGINFYSEFLNGSDESKISDIVQHIKHIQNIGGIDVISLGSDFDGINCNLEIKDISYMDKLEYALKITNFTENEIEKIFYKNAVNFLKNF
ncbi:dipeptidase [Clostridium sp. DL1XJH146]